MKEIRSKKIYLDYAAGTPVHKDVLQIMEPYFSVKYGNPSSLHSFGQEAIAVLDSSRETITKNINADFREIIFTGSATEANNLALRGVVKNLKFKNKHSRIIVSSIEHESVLKTAKDLEKENIEIVIIPVDKNGIIDLQKLKSALNENTVLVSMMYANNEIGTIQPISEISKIIQDFKNQKTLHPTSHTPHLIHHTSHPLFHTDAVQAFQFLDCDVQKLGVGLMTLSAHKIYGPKGIGALYVKDLENKNGSQNQTLINHKSYTLNPITTGGGQEFGFRSGTENIPAIVGFAKAVELVFQNREKVRKQISELKNYFFQELKKICPKAELNGIKNDQSNSLSVIPSILNVYFPDHSSQNLLIKLDMAGIAVSSGSACSMRASKLSHVLQALKFSPKRIQNSLRFSFGRFTTKQELKEVIRRISKILET